MVRPMQTQRRRTSLVFMTLLLVQVLSPLAFAGAEQSSYEPETDAALELLEQVGVSPIATAEYGWMSSEEGSGETALRYRDVHLVPPTEWTERTGESTVDGYHILGHTYPVPSDWFHDLDRAGIDCFSFLPPASFHCHVNSKTPAQLAQLNVLGLAVMDATDKVQTDLVRGLLGLEMVAPNPFVNDAGAIVNVVLSGEELPQGLSQRSDIVLDTHSGRFATMALDTQGLAWLVNQDAIEWVEPRPFYEIMNSKGIEVMHVDDAWDNTIMGNIDSSWSGLDGSGIIVTVADTGLDNGVNNSNMHPDFRDHITGILSFPPPASVCSAYGLSPCGDDAEDHHGHGTHVAGSVLGDGTHSNGDIIGAAPEAHLLFHAIATTHNSEEKLLGIPNDLDDMFELAWANGSRIHTNSWGSAVAGQYTTSSMQADASARTHDEMVILFAAANEGVDANMNGEIDLDSMGSPATAKNVLTVGATENDRGNMTWVWGSTDYGSPISTDRLADNPDGMAAFSSRGPTDDGRLKPDFSAPGTMILSAKSRSTTSVGWLAHNASYTYMGGTSMATPLTAGASALLLEHLMENLGESNPTSALVKAIFTASAHDMTGQYSSSTNGAGEAAPNNHEGWGRINMSQAVNTSYLYGHSVITNADSGWSFNVPSSADDINIALAWTDPASTPSASTNLVNDLDLALKSPSGTWTNLSNNLDNLRGLTLASPAQGTWELHVVGTSVPTGPQFFAVAVTGDYTFSNLTQDTDLDGYEDDDDDCNTTAGTSTEDRTGCPDTDGDGYSNPDSGWTVNNGADAFPSEITQWADGDYDGYGDNAAGHQPDACTSSAGNSTGDRFGCTDTDGDGYSDPDGGWTVANGADACTSVAGPSSQDRNGCADQDGDGYSGADSGWTVANGADAFPTDNTQWADTDGDGYGDNPPPLLQVMVVRARAVGQTKTDLDALTPTAMAILTLTAVGPWPTAPTPSSLMRLSGLIATAMATAITPVETIRMRAPLSSERPPRLVVLDVLTAIATATLILTTPSPTKPHNGPTATATAMGTKLQATKAMRARPPLVHQAATDLGAPIRTATGRRTAIQAGQQQTGPMPTRATEPNGPTATATGTGTTQPAPTATHVHPKQELPRPTVSAVPIPTATAILTPTAPGVWTMALTLTPTTRAAGATATGTVMTTAWMMIAQPSTAPPSTTERDVQTRTGTAIPTRTADGARPTALTPS